MNACLDVHALEYEALLADPGLEGLVVGVEGAPVGAQTLKLAGPLVAPREEGAPPPLQVQVRHPERCKVISIAIKHLKYGNPDLSGSKEAQLAETGLAELKKRSQLARTSFAFGVFFFNFLSRS